MSNVKKYNQFEQIQLYYLNDSKLSEAERNVAERWELAFSLLQKHRSKKVAVKMLIDIVEASGGKLSVPQAYRDMKAAEELFIPLLEYDKKLLRHVLIESAIQDQEDVMKKLEEKDLPHSVYIKLMEIKDKVEKRLIELSGIADEHPDMPDFSKLEVHTYEVNIPEGTAEMLQELMKSGVVDASEILANHAIDVEHEDVSDETD